MQLGVAHRDHAGEQVGVPGERLRRALPGDVGAVVERSLQSGVATVLSQHRSAPPACASRSRAVDVDDVQHRVRRGLDEREPCALAGRREPVGVGRGCSGASRRRTLRADRPRAARPRSSRSRGSRAPSPCSSTREAEARPGRHPAREGQRVRLLERAEQRLGLGSRSASRRGRTATSGSTSARTTSSDRRSARGPRRPRVRRAPRIRSESGRIGRSLRRGRGDGATVRRAPGSRPTRLPARRRDPRRAAPGTGRSRRIVATSR